MYIINRQRRVYADFRKNEAYFDVALDLLLSLYNIKVTEQLAIELKTSLGRLRS